MVKEQVAGMWVLLSWHLWYSSPLCKQLTGYYEASWETRTSSLKDTTKGVPDWEYPPQASNNTAERYSSFHERKQVGEEGGLQWKVEGGRWKNT